MLFAFERVSMYQPLFVHASAITPHTSYNFGIRKKIECDCGAEKGYIWKSKLYDNSAVFWYCDWQIFKCSQTKEEEGKKKQKSKQKQRRGKNWSCQFVPELSQTIPFCSLVGVSVSWQHLSVVAFSFLSGLLYVAGSEASNWQWEEGGRWQIHTLKSFTILTHKW